MRKLIIAVPLLLTGFVVGLFVQDRVSSTPSPSAALVAPADQPRPVAAALTALPDLSVVAERAIQASVNISSTEQVQQQNPYFRRFFGDSVHSNTTLGSGVIVSADGYILTNSHVVGASGAEIKVTLPDSRELPAKVVGVDEVTDLAVVKVEATGLTPLPWGDSEKLRVAEWVLAVGNPFAFSQSVTQGIVSAKSRHDPQLASYADMIQTDAAINPGNSGGALVNSRAELIGINTMIYSETGGNQGLGFAIPSNFARQIMEELRTKGFIPRGSIGLADLRTVSPAAAQRAGLGPIHGVLVADMYEGGPAHRAGVQLNDIVLKVNGKPVEDAEQLQRAIWDAKIGSSVKLELLRRGRPTSVDVPVAKAVRQR